MRLVTCGLLLGTAATALAQPFLLPTKNRALFENGGSERFFVGTVGKPWTSGQFGCVRSDGWQVHEGLDIRCLERDAQGEPADAVGATADGTVAYINAKSALSNYGLYVVLKHGVEGLEVYSNYAHLGGIAPGLRVGQPVKAGQRIGTLGRSTNTRQRIAKDRAHLHFELNLLINDNFPAWYRNTFPDQRNDHGLWNGQNLVALDPQALFLAQTRHPTNGCLLPYLRNQTELCRVLVRDTQFPWLQRYAPLVARNPVAERQGVAGYEISLNFNGLPFRLIPRAASEIKHPARIQLLAVNAAEYQQRPGRRLVTQKSGRWELANNGLHLLGLLTY